MLKYPPGFILPLSRRYRTASKTFHHPTSFAPANGRPPQIEYNDSAEPFFHKTRAGNTRHWTFENLADRCEICFHKLVGSKTKNGFVFVELLLSLTVITILFGVSLKTYQYLRETTQSMQDSEEASQIRRIFENYLDTYGCCPKGIFPVEQWFDLSRKKLDFKAVFSGRNKNANPKGINFIQKVGLKEDALKKPLWIFLCNPWSQQTATIAWTRLEQLRNRTTEWEQIEGIGFVFSYRPQPDEDYRTLLEQKIERERRKNETTDP